MKRGIVIGSRVSTGGNFSFNGSLETDDLIRWLLYWDQITYAGVELNGNIISGNHSADIEFLEREGVFKKKIVTIQPSDMEESSKPNSGISLLGIDINQLPQVLAKARVNLVNELSKSTEDIWTMGQSGGEELILPGGNVQKELIDVQLFNCMPIPRVGTAFVDVLEFKQKYTGELERLRLSLDGLREKVLNSVDERRAIYSVLNEISSSITDMQKALNGSGINTISETVSLYTENPNLTFFQALGSSALTGLPLEVTGAIGVGVPTLCKFIKRLISGGQNLPDPKKDFTYAYKVSRELL